MGNPASGLRTRGYRGAMWVAGRHVPSTQMCPGGQSESILQLFLRLDKITEPRMSPTRSNTALSPELSLPLRLISIAFLSREWIGGLASHGQPRAPTAPADRECRPIYLINITYRYGRGNGKRPRLLRNNALFLLCKSPVSWGSTDGLDCPQITRLAGSTTSNERGRT